MAELAAEEKGAAGGGSATQAAAARGQRGHLGRRGWGQDCGDGEELTVDQDEVADGSHTAPHGPPPRSLASAVALDRPRLPRGLPLAPRPPTGSRPSCPPTRR
jgi:hypothetical protein